MITRSFWAEPITTTKGQIIGCDLITDFYREELPVLNSKYFILSMPIEEKRDLLLQQLLEVQKHSAWFRDHRLFCTLTVDHFQARLCAVDGVIRQVLNNLDFIKLKISESFEGIEYGVNQPLLRTLLSTNNLWLDDLGAGRTNVSGLVTGCYETVKLDRAFFRLQVQQPTFKNLIGNITKYCKRVVVEGIEDKHELAVLNDAGIWAIQGFLHNSVPFSKVHTLL